MVFVLIFAFFTKLFYFFLYKSDIFYANYLCLSCSGTLCGIYIKYQIYIISIKDLYII